MLENNIIEVITAFDADIWVGTIRVALWSIAKKNVVRFKDRT